MATLRDLRRRMSAVASTAKITQAMRMVSAAKLKRAQDAIWSARPYVNKMNEVLSHLIAAVGEEYTNPLILQHNEIKNIVVVSVASDTGFCGSFNTSLFRFTMHHIKEELLKQHPNAQIHIVSVGRRSCNFFKKEHLDIINEFPGIFQHLKFETAVEIVDTVVEKYINGTYDKVIIVHNEFKNLLSQVPTIVNLLPIIPEIKDEEEHKSKYKLDYIFEPDRTAILDGLLPKSLEIKVWRTLLESNAAYNAARMFAMENATNNAYELIKHLELVYNKERQSAITTEMLEIVSAAEGLKKA